LRESYCMEMHTTLQQDRRGSFSCFCPCRHTLQNILEGWQNLLLYLWDFWYKIFKFNSKAIYKVQKTVYLMGQFTKSDRNVCTSSWYLLFFLLCFQKFLVNIMSDIGVHSIKWPVKVHCNFTTIWIDI
jgi:hypothetical protein